jgi:hypothetical protein
MPKYVIERELPGAGKLSPEELKGISQKSRDVLRDLGPEIQWVESFVSTRSRAVFPQTGFHESGPRSIRRRRGEASPPRFGLERRRLECRSR